MEEDHIKNGLLVMLILFVVLGAVMLFIRNSNPVQATDAPPAPPQVFCRKVQVHGDSIGGWGAVLYWCKAEKSKGCFIYNGSNGGPAMACPEDE